MKSLILLMAAMLLLGTVYCIADTTIASADIPFAFKAEGKAYPAGTYRFEENTDENAIVIRGVKGTSIGLVPVMTRLAERQEKEGMVVFDVVGNDHILSEIHVPAMDGFSFKGAPVKHTHVSLKSKQR